jgi:hypothetical protein
MWNPFKKKTQVVTAPKFDLKYEHRVVPAFSCGGVQYWMFEDSNNILSGRGFAAVNFYKELSMSCTREFLIGHTEAVRLILRNNKEIDLPGLDKLNTQLKERLEMIIDDLTPYKVASVIYFDETESPYSFDYDYAFKKIALWKKEKVEDFFLQTPVKNLIPSTLWSVESLENYLKVEKEIDKEHLESIFTILSDTVIHKEWYKTLKLEKNTI